MAEGYRNNHYVPVWYQELFLSAQLSQRKFQYLDLKPEPYFDRNGNAHVSIKPRRWGPASCFRQRDLYTSTLGERVSTEIEQKFFGSVDDEGKRAVEFWNSYQSMSVDSDALHGLIRYMTLQKLRTPKGLSYIARETRARNHDAVLRYLQALQRYYGAIWVEAEWALVDATSSDTKFIVSDHPVTVYNPGCFPESKWCRNGADPEPWLSGTHTIFPLSSERALFLTNTSWIRNPYGSPTKPRPNPNPMRSAVFNFTNIQTGRALLEEEVITINYIIKKRASRFIAAEKESWLYPERLMQSTHWSKFGNGLLLMPDPRQVQFSAEVIFGGFPDGRPAEIWDEYGRRPWHRSFDSKVQRDREWATFHAFQGEFSRLVGPIYRGRANERFSDSDRASPEYFQELLKREEPRLSRRRIGRIR